MRFAVIWSAAARREIIYMSYTNLRFAVLAIAIVISLSVIANAQKQPAPTPPPDETERVETEEIKINVLAYDTARNIVNDVLLEDLVINENNVLNQAVSLRRIPANVVIVMDTGGELRWAKTIGQTRKTAEAIIADLKPADSVAIVEYSDSAKVVSNLTRNRADTAAAIARTNVGVGSAFLDAIKLASGLLTRPGIENRHIVLVTDGTQDSLSGAALAKGFQQLLETDINVHVVSYTQLEMVAIDPRTKSVSTKPKPITADTTTIPREVAEQLPNGARDFNTGANVGPTIKIDRKQRSTWKRRKAALQTAEGQLISLTDSTNGTILIPTTREEMVEKSAGIARIIDGSYVLTYVPKIPLRAKQGDRMITVTSKRAGLAVEAKRKLVVRNRS